jgi:TIR domain/Pentapeptide repeats (8 copies)
MANEEQLKILNKGAHAWNEWRIATRPIIELAGACLPGMELTDIDLHLANLTAVDFSKADLGGASFVNSDMTGANLRGARLAGADLWGAELDNADLSGTLLYDTDFTETSLDGTDFSCSVMDGTRFGGVDLSKARGLNAISHEGPCRIDLDVIYLSEGNIPEVFMVGAGAPDSSITYMKSLVAEPIEYYSCFISYSTKDQQFVNLLHSQLRCEGLRVWLATEDLKIGDRFRTKIDEAIRLHDKLLLVLSKNSMGSPWVESEVEAAFEKEQKQKRTLLFPICLDDTVLETEQAWAADIRRTRHIGDFRKWKDHDQYQNAVARLLRDLKRSAREPAK